MAAMQTTDQARAAAAQPASASFPLGQGAQLGEGAAVSSTIQGLPPSKEVAEDASRPITPTQLQLQLQLQLSSLQNRDRPQLKPHRTRLPTFFYLLSFMPPLPSPFRSPRAFVSHPGVLYAIGTLTAMLAGLGMPALDLLYGLWTKDITPSGVTPDEIRSRSQFIAWIAAVVGVGELLFAWLFLACFTTASFQLSARLRSAYLASIVCQDASYADTHGAGEIAARVGKDATTVRTAFGEKIAYLIWSASTLIAGVIIGFTKAPRVAGVLFALLPFLIIVFGILGFISDKVGAPALRVEAQANSFLQTVLSNIRVVQSFGMESQLIKRFDSRMLEPLERFGMRKAALRGWEMSSVYFILNATYSLAFWYGSIQIVQNGLNLGNLLTAFWNYLNSMFAISNVVPHVASLLEAYATLKTLRAAIERTPKIDVRDNAGVCLPDDGDWEPGFELKNVVFAYPSRPNVATLNDVSLKLPAGKVTALVGPSGSGKSTIANLLLREYDPETANVPSASDEAEAAAAADSDKKRADGDVTDAMDRAEKDEKTDEEKRVAGSGHVLFAGNDVRELNLRWLRAQVAVVPQHPHIFSGLSVWENVALGLSGTSFAYRPGIDDVADDEKAKDRLATIREMCCSALEKAQALDFVQQLPDGMDTAARGLSGGQAQRVAIARALVRQPKILCLDEGTSALDTATEERLKVALQKEQESRGMTMVVVAHRLSTIQHADSVTVMKNGRIVDQGTHSELLEPGRPDSTFKTMWLTQSGLTELDDDTDTDTDSIASLDGKDKDEKHMMRLQQSTTESPSGPSSEEATRVDGQSTRLNSAAGHLTAPHRPEPQPVVTSATTSNSTSRSTYQVSGRTLTIGQLEHSAESSYAAPARLGAGQSSVGSIADEDTDGAGNDFPPLRKRQLFGNLKAYVGPQWWYFFVGFIGAVASGASFPVAGWLTGEAVQALSIQGDNSRLRSEANDWALYFFILALVDLLIIFVNSFFLELGAEKIVRRMKVNGLKALIKQEIGWHDRDENASGSLTSAVTSHPSAVGLASGIVLSTIIIGTANLVGSVILAFILSPLAAVVGLAPVLVLFFSGWLNTALMEKYEAAAQLANDRSAGFVAEQAEAIKTLSALGREEETLRIFEERSKASPKRTRQLLLGAGGFAVSQAMVLFLSALIFYWGSRLLADSTISVNTLYSLFEAIIIAAFSAGRLFTFVPDFSRAINGIKVVTRWIEREPCVASLEPGRGTDAKEAFASEKGADIVFTDVELRYPTRPKKAAIRELNLRIPAGQTVAFCGTSGSGKSTVLSILQRFYEPSRGTITIGGVDIRSIPLANYRAQMAYVSQSSALFPGTARENLLLGCPEPEKITQEQIEAACEQACILDFVRSLPDGLDTDLGLTGSQMSGGQKQRLCIARALLRDPEILLLDEATSALDAESEASVQRALDNASEGRTTITVAHRLSTIRKASRIFVVEDGQVIESGSHEELVKAKGRYFELVQAQL